jgi:hypothetical protein
MSVHGQAPGATADNAMYQVLKDFAGPVATIIAALAAVYVTAHFARKQAWLAREKLRYDLFDRRLQIFSSIFDFYNAMIAWSGTPEQIAARERFFRAYQESRFLFKRESGIEALLKDLNDKGMKVIGFKENRELLRQDPATFIKYFEETSKIQTTDFEEGLAKLKESISKYLNFHDL